ncbi:sporulation protein YunB [Bacillus sp. FJAT-45350]|uniref:sporulation protein YunB n=1 Tax=Bacillus sp. FJAT-45350 TaxID=2011014 RepID=UPI00211C57DE|nr:sporulation protein YunB [Bacillus sp. FJAT-45350]
MYFRKKFNLRPKKGPLPFRYVLLISFAIFIVLTLQGLWLVESGIRPTLLEIANLETQKIATSAINHAVSTTIRDVDMNQLINIEKDNFGKISSIGFDANVYNQVVTNAVSNAQYYLKLMEDGELHKLEMFDEEEIPEDTDVPGVIHNIPLGLATNNALLSQLGPLIPVKFTTIGDVDVELNEETKPIGINNTWIRVSMDLEVQSQVIIPFATRTDKVKTTVPVGMVFVPGEVPDFYSNGDGPLPQPAIIR